MTAHALEQERPDLLKRRQDWFDGPLDVDPARLVFIDETGLEHEDVTASRTSHSWRTMPLPDPTRALEDDDVYRSAQAVRHDRAHGLGRCDERGRIPGL